MKVVQIVPWLPPPPEGVGGYAEALAGALRELCEVETRFVVGDPSWRPCLPDGFTAGRVAARTAGALLDELPAEDGPVVLLHYANYGYQSRGCPNWLVEGLARWRQEGSGRRMVTVFHEVYATGPPWRSSFWLSPLQQRLAATLARLSEALATSLDLYGRMLRPWAPRKEIAVLPVFSTVGEPAEVPPLAERRRRMVVFGSAGVRGRAYGQALPVLEAACETLGIEEVLDIGTPATPPRAVGRVPVRAMGVLPAADVSDLLCRSLAGFVAYPEPFLAKSTIFAAYCAHGVLPVCAGDGRPSQDPPPFWRIPDGPGRLQEIAGRARDWYLGHSIERQAEAYRELLA